MITSVQKVKGKLRVRGVAQDDGEIASVTVNGLAAKIAAVHAGVADWEITLGVPRDRKLSASASDNAGNHQSCR